jgi:hypothetical protein
MPVSTSSFLSFFLLSSFSLEAPHYTPFGLIGMASPLATLGGLREGLCKIVGKLCLIMLVLRGKRLSPIQKKRKAIYDDILALWNNNNLLYQRLHTEIM